MPQLNVKAPLPQTTITIWKGLPFQKKFLFQGENRMPIDLTGKKIRCQVKAKIGDASALYDFSTANGKITVGNGEFTLTGLTAVESAGFTWDDAVGDIVIEEATGVYTPVFRCRFVVASTTTGVPL